MDKPRILIADDEEGIRESLGLILEEEYEVTFAMDGRQALEALRTGRFALALLDIKMPKLDGLEILKQLNGPTPPPPPILMITAYQSVELAKEAVKLGARDYITKPFKRDHVLAAVHDLVKK